MFDIWSIIIIIILGYLLYNRECKNIILNHEIDELKLKYGDPDCKSIVKRVSSAHPKNSAKAELYEKLNKITQKNLGMSLKEMILD